MPRLTSSNPKYRRHRASGQAIVTLDGRDFYLGPHGTRASKAEYDRLVGEWLANGRCVPRPRGGPSDLAVVELIAAFWRHAQEYYGASGHGGELGSFRLALAHLKRLYGPTPAAEFGPLALKCVRQSMIDAGWVRTYINRQVGRLKHVFKWGTAHEMVPASVYHALQAVPGLREGRCEAEESEPVKPVPEAHVYAVRNHVARQVWAMIELQMLTGMRPGEAVIMRTCDIDTTGKLWVYTPSRHKTAHHGHERAVYFGPKAQVVLAPWLRSNVNEYLFQPREAVAESRAERTAARKTPVGSGNVPGSNRRRRPGRTPSDRYTVDSYRRAITAGCEKAFEMPGELYEPRTAKQRRARIAEDPRERREARHRWHAAHVWAPNQLRHNAGTFLRKEFGAEAAQVILGHRNLDVTEIYAEKNVEAAMKIMTQVG